MALRSGLTTLFRRCAGGCAAPDALLAQSLFSATKATPTLISTVSSSVRGISTSMCRWDNSLSTILTDEIKYERDNYIPSEIVAKGPPAPFTLSDDSGDTLLTLTRKFNGEEVVVSCSANDQPAAEEEEEDNLVQFNVSTTKGNQSLVFECISDGTFFQIEHVSFEPKDGFESGTAYTGPVFDELDDAMKASFAEYLQARGIDLNLAEYLRHLVHDKEQKEYMDWLSNVQKFLAGL